MLSSEALDELEISAQENIYSWKYVFEAWTLNKSQCTTFLIYAECVYMLSLKKTATLVSSFPHGCDFVLLSHSFQTWQAAQLVAVLTRQKESASGTR